MRDEEQKVQEPQPEECKAEQRAGLSKDEQERKAEEEALAYESFEINPEPYID